MRQHEASLIATQPQIDAVFQSVSLPIRQMDSNTYYELVSGELSGIIDSYFGAKQGTSPETTAECADVFLERYGNMALAELKQAARFAFSDESKCDIRAFYGQFTVGMFIEMLNAWKQHRDKIRFAIDKKNRTEAEEAEKQRTDAVKRAEFTDLATAWFQDRCLNQDITDYKDIPYDMANYFHRQLEKDVSLRERACEIAIAELKQMSAKAMIEGNGLKAKMLQKVLSNMETDFDPIIAYAKPIYIRLLLLKHIQSWKSHE
jgi:hypothetical protein